MKKILLEYVFPWLCILIITSPMTYILFDYRLEEYVNHLALFVYGFISMGETVLFISCRRDDKLAIESMWTTKQNTAGNYVIGTILFSVAFTSFYFDHYVIGLAALYIMVISTLNYYLIRHKLFNKT